jgi:hypothetical protein
MPLPNFFDYRNKKMPINSIQPINWKDVLQTIFIYALVCFAIFGFVMYVKQGLS